MLAKSSIIIALVLVCCAVYVNSQMVGGLRDEKPADDEAREVIKKLKKDISKKAEIEFNSLEPISYRKQVVAGLNYFIKVKAIEKNGTESHIYVRAYKSFRGELELTAVKTAVDKEKPLNYFQ